MVSFADKPLVDVGSVAQWEAYILEQGTDDGVRLKLRKKLSSAPGITYDEALEVALCHGWIDGQVARFDDDYVLQAFTPRRRASPWSQRNIGIVERLIAEGRMREGGQAEIDRAKADGRWDAAYRVKDAPVPVELQAALDASPSAAEAFAALNAQNRWAFIFRVSQLKRADSRERAAARFAAMLERGEKFY
ncbi:YdeI/OmpD-associated family protein [Salinibacterium soli]|uniref:YdeI/OmpD-associated family protein n=1 Tax=Antiquaquibacter soli TaxID=3064523 RepID=A0ABT9BRM7_9MICO|nr:YdeI/OmpD-associated family protein [Protaetiibacter sp. WY-16]MDO7883699.1 YdeI/OmpD-associated family protein [Protaetiibacter sp. WY-16]